MKKTAIAQDPARPFNEQDLKFRSFGIFLDYAALVCCVCVCVCVCVVT